jgi:hypothetical protein
MGFNTNLLIIGAVLSILFVTVSGTWFTLADTYEVDVPDEYKDTFDKTNGSYDLYNEQQSIMDGGDINTEGQDQAVYSSVIVAMKKGQDAFRLLGDVINSITALLGIPGVIALSLLTILGVLSVASFMSGITGNKN